MAKTNYEVNSTAKYLDIHNRFNGGLKTVDTDDSLKAFYLRDVENVSLSEFGFLEKRYGIVETEDSTFPNVTVSDYIQGYFEYNYNDSGVAKTDEVIFITGKLYLRRDGGSWSQVTTLTEDTDELYATGVTGGVAKMLELGFTVATGTWTFTNPFATGKEIEATRIDDTLYIFTGVYPITYSSDGVFRPLPEFLPTFSELKVFSHNIHNFSNDEYYNQVAATTGGGVQGSTTDKGIRMKDYSYYPYLPYLKDTASDIFNVEFSYYYPNREPYYTDFTYFATWTGTTLNQIYPSIQFDGASTAYGIGAYAYMTPRVYYRTAGIGASNLEWEELGKENFSFPTRSNLLFQGAGTDERFWKKDGTSPTDIWIDRNPDYTLTNSSGCKIGIQSMPEGVFDIKVELEITLAGYILTGDPIAGLDDRYQWKVDTIDKVDFIINDVRFTKEQLTDHLDIEPNDLWSCNKVLNHYGKLMAYGSDTNPERVFVGHPTYKNYFPEYFTLDFETDSDETVQKITPFMNILVVQSETYTWGLKGIDALVDAANPYSQFVISPIYGTIAPKSVRPVRNHLYFLSKEGLVKLKSFYANDDQYNIEPIDDNISNIVPLDTDAVAIQFDNQYWINFPNNDMTLRYYVDKEAWVKDIYFNYNGIFPEDSVVNPNQPILSSTVHQGVHKYIRKNGDLIMLFNSMDLGGTGTYSIKKVEIDNGIPTDLMETPRTMFETSYLNQGYPFHPKKYLETKLDFTIQNEYAQGKAPVYVEDEIDISATTTKTLSGEVELIKNHMYLIESYNEALTGATVTLYDANDNVVSGTVTVTVEDDAIKLVVGTATFEYATIDVTFENLNEDSEETVVISDITYDNSINFKTLITSEEQVLNLDPEDYGDTYKNINVELGSNFGSWTFGEDTFGNKLTIVKTVKLSGKGYNLKLTFVDFTKSKWTLENIGIAHKLRKARRR